KCKKDDEERSQRRIIDCPGWSSKERSRRKSDGGTAGGVKRLRIVVSLTCIGRDNYFARGMTIGRCLIAFAILAAISSCASPGMPPGGPVDTTAPLVIGITPDS